MKNRIIYWGGKENTMIPRMGSCGEGVEVEAAGGGGAEGGEPQKPAKKVAADDGPGLFDKLRGILPKLAIGALALATVAGVAMMLRKNRKPPGTGGTGGGPGTPDGLGRTGTGT